MFSLINQGKFDYYTANTSNNTIFLCKTESNAMKQNAKTGDKQHQVTYHLRML